MALIVGLTGGVGSGKSTVAKLFAKHGVPVIDADLMARELTLPNQATFSIITKHFKEPLLLPDQSLDRTKLRHIIFEQPKEREWLENLLHPIIRKKIEEDIKKITAPYCIVVIPLLFEVDPYDFIDRILVVDATEQHQIERVAARDKIDPLLVEKILHSQVTRQQRLAGANDVICNDGALADLIARVEELHRSYSHLSSRLF
ncbi:MAG TPA: dephospho-CoA kinase [Gammaproteobacteria bacterium]|nr:dephospho-CoA kinase [Gammaproteobacteria bacterium]